MFREKWNQVKEWAIHNLPLFKEIHAISENVEAIAEAADSINAHLHGDEEIKYVDLDYGGFILIPISESNEEEDNQKGMGLGRETFLRQRIRYYQDG